MRKQLIKMQCLREAAGFPQNPFTEKEIKRISSDLIERGMPWIKTGCFKFYLSKTKKNLICEFRPIRFRIGLGSQNTGSGKQ